MEKGSRSQFPQTVVSPNLDFGGLALRSKSKATRVRHLWRQKNDVFGVGLVMKPACCGVGACSLLDDLFANMILRGRNKPPSFNAAPAANGSMARWLLNQG
jgi:hypothetical protein